MMGTEMAGVTFTSVPTAKHAAEALILRVRMQWKPSVHRKRIRHPSNLSFVERFNKRKEGKHAHSRNQERS
jgi:hypothetical protein